MPLTLPLTPPARPPPRAASPPTSLLYPLLSLQISAKDYLETALLPVPGSGASVEAKNSIRSSIKSLFPDRDCVTLVRGGGGEAHPW